MQLEKRVLIVTFNARLKEECRKRAMDAELGSVQCHSYHSLGLKYYAKMKCNTDTDIQSIVENKYPLKFRTDFEIIFIDEIQDMNK